jgi:hypothetical protein
MLQEIKKRLADLTDPKVPDHFGRHEVVKLAETSEEKKLFRAISKNLPEYDE